MRWKWTVFAVASVSVSNIFTLLVNGKCAKHGANAFIMQEIYNHLRMIWVYSNGIHICRVLNAWHLQFCFIYPYICLLHCYSPVLIYIQYNHTEFPIKLISFTDFSKLWLKKPTIRTECWGSNYQPTNWNDSHH